MKVEFEAWNQKLDTWNFKFEKLKFENLQFVQEMDADLQQTSILHTESVHCTHSRNCTELKSGPLEPVSVQTNKKGVRKISNESHFPEN